MLLIREAKLQDVDAIAALFHNTIRRINAKDYSPAQIETWAGAGPESEKWRVRLGIRQTFVACLDGNIVGFAEFESDGHIDAIYVHHEYQGEGIASRLLERIELEAEHLGVARIYTEASISAVLFFESKGFVLVQPQDVEYRGLKFRNYRMEKYRTV